ncbi:MAG TPA: hypothetical protein VF381_02600 [Thermoanaerobaculia bacterium]
MNGVIGHWSSVIGHRSSVIGHRSSVIGGADAFVRLAARQRGCAAQADEGVRRSIRMTDDG